MRIFLVIFGLAIGMAVAAVTEGRMSHIRALASDRLPGWTRGLSDASGLGRGTLPGVKLSGSDLAFDLNWTFNSLQTRGIWYDVNLAGAGVDIDARVLMPFGMNQKAEFQAFGQLNLGQIFARGDTADVQGVIAVESLTGRYDLGENDLLELAATARWLDARFEGMELEEPQIGIVTTPDGAWMASLNIVAPTVNLVANVSGSFHGPSAVITAEITRKAGFPNAWLAYIPQAVQGADGVWQVGRDIDLPALHLTDDPS